MAPPTTRSTGAHQKNPSRAGQSSTDNAGIQNDGTQRQSSDYDDAEEINASQLQEQIQDLAKNQSQTDNILGRILDRLTALGSASDKPSAASSSSPLPQVIAQSTERNTPDSATPSSSTSHKYSKKQPDPQPLSNGQDPTFPSWKIQIQGKFRSNADHFQDEEDKMLYLFNRTTGDAQRHLQPRYDEDSQTRFASAREMIEYLASIYTNPNQARDARYEYNHHCTMKTTQTFAEFQTQFLHLAGEAQISQDSLRLDLYDRLTTPLQRGIAPMLRTLNTYQELSASCLSLDTELKRITAREERQKRYREKSAARPPRSSSLVPSHASTPNPTIPRSQLPASDFQPRTTILAPERPTIEKPRANEAKRPAPADTIPTCYNCYKKGHFAATCTEPKRVDFKEIDGGEPADNEQSYDSYDSGKEEP